MRDLTKLDADQLAEVLIEVARSARKASAVRDVFTLHDLVAAVRAAADSATGSRLLVLEVAEAFLRAVARTDLGRTEMSIRRFVDAHPTDAEALLNKLNIGSVISEEDIDRLDSGAKTSISELVEMGALIKGRHGYTLRGSLTAFVADLLEPLALRMWRYVETARRTAKVRTKLDEQAASVAGSLGVSHGEALRHLVANPLVERPTPRDAQQGAVIASRRNRVLYAGRTRLAEESGPASASSAALARDPQWNQRLYEIIAPVRHENRRSQGERVTPGSVLN